MLKNQRVRRKDTRAAEIIAHATTLFLEKGYENTNFQDIATAGQMARSTIYLYFKEKQELLRACIKERFELNKNVLLNLLYTENDAFETRVTTLITRLQEIFKDETTRRFYVMVANLSTKYDDIAKMWLEEVLLPMKAEWNTVVSGLGLNEKHRESLIMVIFSTFFTSCVMSVSFNKKAPLMSFDEYCDFFKQELSDGKFKEVLGNE